ncbi:MAG TPA: DinB family protein [Acidimicrobiales bacterium]|jgi:uncharacterized damage-inducible protein DinB|nr:DinB family protein [Acidimicrobiales bacterium]
MNALDDQGRLDPPEAGDEAATLVGFLEFQRATFAWKSSGLDSAALAVTIAPSSMTLGGMIKHLALVEDSWLTYRLMGLDHSPPWDHVDWARDPDWEWHSAAADAPEALRSLWDENVDRSRAHVGQFLAHGDVGQLAKRTSDAGRTRAPSLRWILCHMIEEYARHNGHADLLREAIDGETGE